MNPKAIKGKIQQILDAKDRGLKVDPRKYFNHTKFDYFKSLMNGSAEPKKVGVNRKEESDDGDKWKTDDRDEEESYSSLRRSRSGYG